MEQRFAALHGVVVLIRVLAWLVLIVGIVSAVSFLIGALLGGLDALGEYGLPVPTPLGAGVGMVAGLILSVLEFIFLYAAADFIGLLLAIEENTRALRLWSERQALMGIQPTPPAYSGSTAPYPPSYYTPPASPVPPAPPEFPQPR